MAKKMMGKIFQVISFFLAKSEKKGEKINHTKNATEKSLL